MKKMNKSGVSIMLSYVLLISIVLALSIGVFSWLKLVSNIQPEVDCKEDTSLIIQDYICDSSSLASNFELTLKNNGRFNIEGVIVTVGDNSDEIPTVYLIPIDRAGTYSGNYYFPHPLKPGEEITASFLNRKDEHTPADIEIIRVVEIQPFIIQGKNKIICKNAVKRIPIEDCEIISDCIDYDLDNFKQAGVDCGLIDCDDYNEYIFPTNPNLYCDCVGPIDTGTAENTEVLCNDNYDNDCDGKIDLVFENEDEDCQTCSAQEGVICESGEGCEEGHTLTSLTPGICCDESCILTCSAQGGVICGVGESCDGIVLTSPEPEICCDVECTLPQSNCADQGGDICGDTDLHCVESTKWHCFGDILPSPDTEECCSIEWCGEYYNYHLSYLADLDEDCVVEGSTTGNDDYLIAQSYVGDCCSSSQELNDWCNLAEAAPYNLVFDLDPPLCAGPDTRKIDPFITDFINMYD